MKPRVSVIIPTYNRRDTIGEALECMLRQTLQPHELIVVDDGSSDQTATLVRSFRNRVLLIEQANAGPGAARNAGLAYATGEFVQFFDSDDLVTSDKLELQAAALMSSGADVAYSPWVQAWFQEEEVRIGRHVFQQSRVPRPPLSAFLRGWILFMPACLIRRTLVERLGGYPTAARTGEDLELLMRIILSGARFVHVPGPLLLVRQHPASQISRAPEFGPMRVRERAHFVDVVDQLLMETRAPTNIMDRMLWQATACQARSEQAAAEGYSVPARGSGFARSVNRLRRLAAGLRARAGGSRLGSLFAPGYLTKCQRAGINSLGYMPVVE